MKPTLFLPAFVAFFFFTIFARAVIITINPDQDTFVRSADPTHDFGGAGALSVSGSASANASGTNQGVTDSFLRFSFASVTGSLNQIYGANNWTITGVTLVVTEIGTPNNAIFNRGQGQFEIRWIANDTWIAGSGTPMAPGNTGITYNTESSALTPGTDVSLGIFSNIGPSAGTSGTSVSFSLPLTSSAFKSDMEAGGPVSFFLTAASPSIGFTMNSVDFVQPAQRPVLSITAVPEPRTGWLLVCAWPVFFLKKIARALRSRRVRAGG